MIDGFDRTPTRESHRTTCRIVDVIEHCTRNEARHEPAAGIIGAVGTIFGKHKVNIAQMSVGRTTPGGEAIGVLNLDALPPQAALDEVSSHPDIQSVRVIELPAAGQLPTWLQ